MYEMAAHRVKTILPNGCNNPHIIDEWMKLNQTSSQLYRLLLRSITKCHREQVYVDRNHKNNHTIHSSVFINKKDIFPQDLSDHHLLLHGPLSMDQTFLLLQPVLQPKDYGMAKIVHSNESLLWTPTLSTSSSNKRTMNTQNQHDDGDTPGVISCILNFFKQQSIHKNSSSSSSSNKASSSDEEEGTKKTHVASAATTTTADSPDRSSSILHHSYPALFVSCKDLKHALRQSFWRIPFTATTSSSTTSSSWDKQKILLLQRQAIDALNILDQQIQQYLYQTSISCDWDRGIRIIATSKCIGGSHSHTMNHHPQPKTTSSSVATSLQPHTTAATAATTTATTTSSPQDSMIPSSREWKYRFAYRIRVEKMNPTVSVASSNQNPSIQAIQLLGRSWFIVGHLNDLTTTGSSSSSTFTAQQPNPTVLFDFWNQVQDTIMEEEKEKDEEERNENNSNNDDMITIQKKKKKMKTKTHIESKCLDVVTVKAPTTGAVGHLPVLQEGQVFEYMSGCEISTKKGGSMGGCFHFASVDKDTVSGYVGDPIDAFQLDPEYKFRVWIHPFGLIVE